MGRIGRDRVADKSAVRSIVCRRVDRDPVGSANGAHHTAGERAHADGIIGQDVAVIGAAKADDIGAGRGVLADGERLIADEHKASPGKMGWIGGDAVTHRSAGGRVAGHGVDSDPIGAADRGHDTAGGAGDVHGVIRGAKLVVHCRE